MNRAGMYHNNLTGAAAYQSFRPNPLPPVPEVEENANLDVSDVINYVKATQYAMNRLKELPLCCRLIREIHEVLMDGVRGQDMD